MCQVFVKCVSVVCQVCVNCFMCVSSVCRGDGWEGGRCQAKFVKCVKCVSSVCQVCGKRVLKSVKCDKSV